MNEQIKWTESKLTFIFYVNGTPITDLQKNKRPYSILHPTAILYKNIYGRQFFIRSREFVHAKTAEFFICTPWI